MEKLKNKSSIKSWMNAFVLVAATHLAISVNSVCGKLYGQAYYDEPHNGLVLPVKKVVDYYVRPKYAFGYEVEDYYNQLSHGRWEVRDGDVTQGQYRVLLPDGRIQIVSYIADKAGYRPTVEYIGKGVHPPPPPAYANVQIPKFVHTVDAGAPVEPIVVAPTPVVTPVVHQPIKLRVNPAVLTPINGPGVAPQHHYDPVLHYGRHYPGDPIFAGSKISKKRALLYNKTLFRKDVERKGKGRLVKKIRVKPTLN